MSELGKSNQGPKEPIQLVIQNTKKTEFILANITEICIGQPVVHTIPDVPDELEEPPVIMLIACAEVPLL